MKTKMCSRCRIEKPIDDFSSDKRRLIGKTSHCKKCQKKCREEHKAERKKYDKKYYEEHKQELKMYLKKYYEEHKQELKIHNKKYREEHREELNNHNKKYAEEHKAERKKYREEHKEQIAIQIKKYRRKRRKTDIRFKITGNLCGRVNKAIKNNAKSLSTMLLIGCEIDYLLFHLQSQFTNGMSWENYGKWHVDHIKPCAKFDLSKESEQRKCFSYKNLQPLWARDNLHKRAKWCDK